ncbi:MAG TPA: A/G-specific adenine glycosylase [Candidatus Thermoplasmatota archaeon]|nr:A/G-specific adenine glycosylase [Candidatus Thermoplasmatota archaeon]
MDEAARVGLLAWYAAARRDLPWRRTRDPYAILVSEMMLQQTRVDVAAPYYGRWMARWPTLEALAAARGEEVLAAWSGLGYYRRARSLHAAAQAILRHHAGQVPREPGSLRALPGIGPYTAAAVASIAHGVPAACVDGNVERVVARVAGIRTRLDAPARRRIAGLAQQWLRPEAPGDWNQAMMELGATLCTPRRPQCGQCPVASSCASRGKDPEAVPRRKPAAAARKQSMHFAVVRRKGAVLLVRTPPTGLLGGMMSLPGGPASVPLARQVAQQTGLQVDVARPGATVRHQFSHRTWSMRVRAGTCAGGRPAAGARWVREDALAEAALPAAMRKALRAGGVEA